MLFCSFTKRITPKICWFCLVLINSVLLNILWVWILFWRERRAEAELNLARSRLLINLVPYRSSQVPSPVPPYCTPMPNRLTVVPVIHITLNTDLSKQDRPKHRTCSTFSRVLCLRTERSSIKRDQTALSHFSHGHTTMKRSVVYSGWEMAPSTGHQTPTPVRSTVPRKCI